MTYAPRLLALAVAVAAMAALPTSAHAVDDRHLPAVSPFGNARTIHVEMRRDRHHHARQRHAHGRDRVSTRRHARVRAGHPTGSAVAMETHRLFGWSSSGLDRRPHAWCGWYARHHLVAVDPGPAFNLARNWAHWGAAAAPGPGVMVVWRHHIGKITGPCRGHICLVTSGNDARAVRTRERSVAGAIAFRI